MDRSAGGGRRQEPAADGAGHCKNATDKVRAGLTERQGQTSVSQPQLAAMYCCRVCAIASAAVAIPNLVVVGKANEKPYDSCNAPRAINRQSIAPLRQSIRWSAEQQTTPETALAGVRIDPYYRTNSSLRIPHVSAPRYGRVARWHHFGVTRPLLVTRCQARGRCVCLCAGGENRRQESIGSGKWYR